MVKFGEYDLRARIGPGLLAIAPVTVAVVFLGIKSSLGLVLPGGAAIWIVLGYLLAILVQYRGKVLEPRLWASWGGRDTTRLLRTRTAPDNPVQRDQWRSALQAVTTVKLLDLAAESTDPVLADQTIEAAIGQVLPLGRGHEKYPLVFDDNIRYGFERNLWGIRWVGRTIAAGCVVALAILLVFVPVKLGHTTISRSALVSGIVIDGLFLLGWIAVPSLKRVHFASERYARGLLEAVVSESQKLPDPQPAKRSTRRPRS